MRERTQFNVRIGKNLTRKIARDRTSGVTNEIIAEVALENLFSLYTPEKRAQFYRAHYRRPYAQS